MPSSAEHSETSARAEPPLLARTWNSATNAPIRRLLTTHAAIATVQSASRQLGISGWRRELPNFCQFPIATSYSLCRQEVSALAWQNQRLLYSILFRAVSETLLAIAADPHRLGAHIGFLAVLHTWNQQMLYHPHLHCVVPSGGLSPDGSRWVSSRARFFLPVKVLGKLFRGKFLAFLAYAFRKKNPKGISALHGVSERDTPQKLGDRPESYQ
jgi:Putative transposase